MKEKNGTASGKSAGTAPHLTTKKKNARSAGNESIRQQNGLFTGNVDPGQAAGDRGQAEPMGIRPPGESGLRAWRRAPIGERTAASGTSPSDMSVPGKHRPVTARSCAMEVLLRCERSGQYSNIALDAALERSGLSAEDRALTARLVYGVTERRITLDRILSSLSDREDMEPEVRTALRLGLYQLAYLDRIPDHAAVDESVRLVSRRASGFVNAVLRQFLRTGKLIPLPPEPDAADLAGQAGPGTAPAAIPAVSVSATAPAASARNPEQVHVPPLSDTARKKATEYLSVLCSVPAPLVSKFLGFCPYDRVKSLLLAFGETAPLTLRVNTEKTTRDDLIALLEKAGVPAQPARYAPTGVTLPAGAGTEAGARVLILGEQLFADALRTALEARGFAAVRVLSFYETDRALLRPGDAKLAGEDELRAELAAPGVELLLADPDCFPLAPASLRRIALPNPGSMSVFENIPARDMVGKKLDRWLDEALKEV